MKQPSDDSKPVTKKVLIETLIEFWKQVAYPMIEKKADITTVKSGFDQLSYKIDKVATDVKDIKRKITDIELDTPTKSEFTRLEKRVRRLENRTTN
jgi:cell division protein FtsL